MPVDIEKHSFARVGAARLLLESLEAEPVKHRVASGAQCAAILALLRQKQYQDITEDKICTLVERVLEVKWTEPDLLKVTEAFSAKGQSGSSTSSRRAGQDYRTFINFFASSYWNQLLDSEVDMAQKKAIILEVLLSLNLTIPSEPTLKPICSFWCCVSEPPDKIMRIPLATRLSLKHEPIDMIHLLMLGNTVPCRLVYKFDSSFSCRGAGKPASMETSVDVNVGGNQASLLMSMMAQFMQHRMHQEPEPSISLLTTPGGSKPVGLRALGNLRDRTQRRALPCPEAMAGDEGDDAAPGLARAPSRAESLVGPARLHEEREEQQLQPQPPTQEQHQQQEQQGGSEGPLELENESGSLQDLDQEDAVDAESQPSSARQVEAAGPSERAVGKATKKRRLALADDSAEVVTPVKLPVKLGKEAGSNGSSVAKESSLGQRKAQYR